MKTDRTEEDEYEDKLFDKFVLNAMLVVSPPIDFYGAEQTKESYKKYGDKCYTMARVMMEARKRYLEGTQK
jgi:hypothetical protein